MRVKSIRLQNYRSFVDSGEVDLGPINVLVGPNNTGKSSILRALYLMQHGGGDFFPDVRVGDDNAHVGIWFEDVRGVKRWGDHQDAGDAFLEVRLKTPDRRTGERAIGLNSAGRASITGEQVLFQSEEPKHFIVPFLSRRKVSHYDETVKESTTKQVQPTMANLAAKLSRFNMTTLPAYPAYAKACMDILGMHVGSTPSQNGHRPGIYVTNDDTVHVDQMGEGVASIVDLLASLALYEGKLFLVEEPENDVHPAALKALLALIVESSKKNQFVISTHSNIVVRYLCSQLDSRLYQLKSVHHPLPTTASIELVAETTEARIGVLRELGYELSDFDLWEGWLILEESTAEKIIRGFLIPWFAQKLTLVRTISADGASKVEPTFEDFRRLFLYGHLESVYRGRAWVRCDGDKAGRDVIEKLKGKFKDVDPTHLGTFGEEQFENYYPKEFAEEVLQVLAISDRQMRREAKRQLFLKVEAWLRQDEDRAKAALKESAAEVIADLRSMEVALTNAR